MILALDESARTILFRARVHRDDITISSALALWWNQAATGSILQSPQTRTAAGYFCRRSDPRILAACLRRLLHQYRYSWRSLRSRHPSLTIGFLTPAWFAG
jgi:hypothetical protein